MVNRTLFRECVGFVFRFPLLSWESSNCRVRSILCWSCSLFAVAAIHFLAGCKTSDQNWDNQQTLFVLRLWAETILVVHKTGADDSLKYDSIRSVFTSWKNKGIIRESERQLVPMDYWESELRWEVRSRNEDKSIRITSAGRNTLYEEGEGDDLYVEITLPMNGEPVLSFQRR
jgi:hypothetical protein